VNADTGGVGVAVAVGVDADGRANGESFGGSVVVEGAAELMMILGVSGSTTMDGTTGEIGLGGSTGDFRKLPIPPPIPPDGAGAGAGDELSTGCEGVEKVALLAPNGRDVFSKSTLWPQSPRPRPRPAPAPAPAPALPSASTL